MLITSYLWQPKRFRSVSRIDAMLVWLARKHGPDPSSPLTETSVRERRPQGTYIHTWVGFPRWILQILLEGCYSGLIAAAFYPRILSLHVFFLAWSSLPWKNRILLSYCTGMFTLWSCLQVEGIFRINPENGHEGFVLEQLNKGIVPSDEIDVHAMASLIKVSLSLSLCLSASLPLSFSLCLSHPFSSLVWLSLSFSSDCDSQRAIF